MVTRIFQKYNDYYYNMDFDEKLRDIYYKKSGKYKGIDRLWNYVRGRDGFFGVKFREVKAFVEKQQSYQVTKAFKAPGATTKGKKYTGITEDKGNGYTTVRAPKPGSNLQIDLMFFNPKEKIDTTKYSGVLNVLDVNSRKAWSEPFRKKKPTDIKPLFEKIVNRIEQEKGKGIVRHVNQDDGTEFKGVFKQYLRDKNIRQHISARDDFAKNPIVERFNRTLREIMAKFEEDYPSEQILKHWSKLLRGYNRAHHRTIKNKPQSVWEGGKNKQKYYDVDYLFKTGATVRVVRKKGILEKGKYAWKPGLYTIHKKRKRGFVLKDKNGVKQARRYMGYELQLVDPDIQVSKQYSEAEAKKAKKAKAKAKAKKKQKKTLKKEGISVNLKENLKELPPRVTLEKTDEYAIDKILDRRKKKNRYEYLVSWKGYSDQTWEPKSSFTGGAQNIYEKYDETIKSRRRSKRLTT